LHLKKGQPWFPSHNSRYQHGTYSWLWRSLSTGWAGISPNLAKAVGKEDTIMTNTDPNRGRSDEVRPVQVKQVTDSSVGMIAAVVILVVVVIGGFIWYNSSYRTESTTAPVTQNNTTTVPAQPAPEAPATQPPAAPAPEAPAPATPPATPPATNN
jgi:hypothetical protein